MGGKIVTAGASNQDVVLSWPGGTKADVWGIAEEVAIEINVNDVPLAVMMATPTELENLAIGFAFTEGVVIDPAGVKSVDAKKLVDGWIVNLRVDPGLVNDQARRARLLEGRAGCGLCGVDTLAAAMRRPLIRAGDGREKVSDTAIRSAFAQLPALQPLNQVTHSVHAAAWCTLSGEITNLCEDVGRHNALDKLVGWHIRDADVQQPGFVAMSSRLSYELVCKAAAMGACVLAAVSAPTSLALQLARQADLPLAFVGPDDALVRFEP